MILAWVISLIATFFLGYYLRTIKDTLEITKEALKNKIEKKPVEESKSVLIDPLDEIQTAQYLMQKQMKELNGE